MTLAKHTCPKCGTVAAEASTNALVLCGRCKVAAAPEGVDAAEHERAYWARYREKRKRRG